MPTYRQTSREAYEDIKSSGVLAQRLFETYEAVFHHPRSTRYEVSRLFPSHHNPEGTYGRALSFLVKAGVLYVPLDPSTGDAFKRPCNVSGRNSIVYEVTPAVPSKDEVKALLASKRPSTQAISKAVQDIRDLVRIASSHDPSFKPSPELIEVAKWLRDSF